MPLILLLADKRSNKFLVQCYHLGNWGPINLKLTVALAQLARAFEVGCSNPSRDRPNSETGSDSSTAKRSSTGMSVTGPRR